MKLSERQLAALRSIAAYIRVWVHWSRESKDIALAGLYRRGAYSKRTLESLRRLGLYVPGAGPKIVGDGHAPVLTDEGRTALETYGELSP